MPKHLLRSRLLLQRRALSRDAWSESSRAAQINLLSLDEYVAADSIALYAPIHNETDTGLIFFDAIQAGKRVLYPAVCGRDMVLRRVERPEDLRKGKFGVAEPGPAGKDYQADEVDLIVVPGVAFDLSGHRVGYGKGFYDRFLNSPDRSGHILGLCHDFQIVDEAIQPDRHDIPVETIVSDVRIIRVQRI